MKRFAATLAAATLAAALAASTVLVTLVPAQATPPGENGRIAFRRYFNETIPGEPSSASTQTARGSNR